MPQPPFDVAIRVERATRGVYKYTPIGRGIVTTPKGDIEVRIGIDELVPRPGSQPTEKEPLRLSVTFGDIGLRIDVTDMLERIVNEYEKEPPSDLHLVQ